MLEFTWWFFVLLANFLILLFMLNIILFKPMLRVFQQREDTIKDALDRAKKMNDSKDEAVNAMKRDLEQARLRARDAYEQIKGESIEKQKEMLTKAHEEALRYTEKIRGELKAETEKARAAMRGEVEKFADNILEKLVRT